MKVSYLLLISLLIVGLLFVPAVSASDYGLDVKTGVYERYTAGSEYVYPMPDDNPQTTFRLNDLRLAYNFSSGETFRYIHYFNARTINYAPGYTYYTVPSIATAIGSANYQGNHIADVEFRIIKNDIGYCTITFEFTNWNSTTLNQYSDLTGYKILSLNWEVSDITEYYDYIGQYSSTGNTDKYFDGCPLLAAYLYSGYPRHAFFGNDSYDAVFETNGAIFRNGYKIEQIQHPQFGYTGYIVEIYRDYDDASTGSTVNFYDDTGNFMFAMDGDTVTLWQDKFKVEIVPFIDVPPKIIWDSTDTGVVPTPTPDETIPMRTGSVTMTDHNGTTISGFEVTAVNAYTGHTYNVSTETDVAVMNLPMDRTIEIRNPQTGVYEEAPIGYYKFYGQAPGYKMLNEDGIRISVLPEEYTSYQLCDILVTSESGYLSGQHKFQIRSRSDNSVLQTGSISAKSATTGEWYNTTVSDGIATLILPYDTSNPISQYAGNYYVYATSPGYEDSDYGTQIIVMPRTTSEIRDILLTPIGGVPAAGNVTLRIQAFSETGPGVVNANIFIAGVIGEGVSVWDTYTASATGYLEVSVPGNSTYDIVASGAGYYDSARRIEVFTEDPPLIEIKLYLSGAPTVEPTSQPTGWPTTQPTTTPTGGIPDDDDGSESFLMQAVRGIGLAFGVGFSTAKLIFGMLLALSIGFATAKHLRGGAAEFGLGLVGGTMLGVLIGLLPVWTVVVLLLIIGLYIGNRYIGGGANNG